MIWVRSRLTPSGITATKFRSICAAARAMAMLVEPLDASTTVPPGAMSPRRRALPRMNRAIRSLVNPLGLRNSSLHQIVGPDASSRTGTSGVGATRSR